jgi:hypothetical protein
LKQDFCSILPPKIISGIFVLFSFFTQDSEKLNIFLLFPIFPNSFANRAKSGKILKTPKILNVGVVFIIKSHFYSLLESDHAGELSEPACQTIIQKSTIKNKNHQHHIF